LPAARACAAFSSSRFCLIRVLRLIQNGENALEHSSVCVYLFGEGIHLDADALGLVLNYFFSSRHFLYLQPELTLR
jgi:hypothetical protein